MSKRQTKKKPEPKAQALVFFFVSLITGLNQHWVPCIGFLIFGLLVLRAARAEKNEAARVKKLVAVEMRYELANVTDDEYLENEFGVRVIKRLSKTHIKVQGEWPNMATMLDAVQGRTMNEIESVLGPRVVVESK